MVNIVPTKLTEEDILNRIYDKHGDNYAYKYFGLIRSHDYISIKCNSCSHEFKQKLYSHINGSGCLKCGRTVGAKKKKRSQDEFLKICNSVHGTKYDYSETIYTLSTNKVKIICPVHGAFYQIANNHIGGQGCAKCSNCTLIDNEEFKKRSIAIHGDAYDYSLVDYKGAHKRVNILCPKHGVFKIKPNAHTSRKTGCPSCSKKRMANKNKIPFSVFLKKSQEIHNNYYEYNENSYNGSDSDVEVTCPVHGVFKQRAISHSKGHGCFSCGRNLNGFARTNFKKICDKRNNGIGSLYLIKCWLDDEVFYKIGITSSKNIKRRFYGDHMPYNYEILEVVTDDASVIYDLENSLQRASRMFAYSPVRRFKGDGECFSKVDGLLIKKLKAERSSNQMILIA